VVQLAGYLHGLGISGREAIVPLGDVVGAVSLDDGSVRVIGTIGNGFGVLSAREGAALVEGGDALWSVGPTSALKVADTGPLAAAFAGDAVIYATLPTTSPDPTQPATIIHSDAALWRVSAPGAEPERIRSDLLKVMDIAVQGDEVLYTQEHPSPWKLYSPVAFLQRGPLRGPDAAYVVDGWRPVAVEADPGGPFLLLANVTSPGCRLQRWDGAAWGDVLTRSDRYCLFSELVAREGTACFDDSVTGEEAIVCWSQAGSTVVASGRMGVLGLGLTDDEVVWLDQMVNVRAVKLMVIPRPR